MELINKIITNIFYNIAHGVVYSVFVFPVILFIMGAVYYPKETAAVLGLMVAFYLFGKLMIKLVGDLDCKPF